MDSEEILLHLAFDGKLEDFDKFKCASGDNAMLKEATNAQKDINETWFLENHATGLMLNQMSSKARIRKHVEKAVRDPLKEFTQLEEEDTLTSVDYAKLTRCQKIFKGTIFPQKKERCIF